MDANRQTRKLITFNRQSKEQRNLALKTGLVLVAMGLGIPGRLFAHYVAIVDAGSEVETPETNASASKLASRAYDALDRACELHGIERLRQDDAE